MMTEEQTKVQKQWNELRHSGKLSLEEIGYDDYDLEGFFILPEMINEYDAIWVVHFHGGVSVTGVKNHAGS